MSLFPNLVRSLVVRILVVGLITSVVVGCGVAVDAACGSLIQDDDQPSPNIATNVKGEFPRDEDGRELNFGFEKGTLDDWKADGQAFQQQPIEGPIDPNRPFGADKNAEHVGGFWLGGYEKLQDQPKGTLTSTPFKVTKPWASFLIGGGNHPETRVELIRQDTNTPLLKVTGVNTETLRPVVVDLRSLQGQLISIRVVDQRSDGWGHVNFDDFRVYDERPKFVAEEIKPRQDLQIVDVYPHAGLDAETAASVMQLPAGFTAQVGAEEPDVNQPIALAIDDRGRVWIAEAYEYPVRAKDGAGTDRILIFEDTNGDGRLDSRTVFAENLNLVSGMEVGFGGVFVGAAPYLLFIPDRDGDDVPDGEPEILLDGWGYEDTHETLNAFIWGPDGWLYGCHGVFTHSRVGKPGTSDEDRIPLNAGIWRYHPVKHSFEVFAYGTSNPWGVDFDDHGQAFATACVIPHLFHVIQGARYQRQAGSHFNPHIYQDIQTIAEHRHFVGNQWNDSDRKRSDELGGGHAHAGAMIYLGGSWPEEYRSHILMNNIHGNRLNMDKLTKQGSGYVGSRAPDFLLTGDVWSQMINMRYGPDGQMWVIDWYDANQCHHREEDAHDRTNGRIYRVVYGNPPRVKVNLQEVDNQRLVEMLSNRNDWYVRHARRILQERAAEGAAGPGVWAAIQKQLLAEGPVETRLRHLWALHVTGGLTPTLARQLLEDPEPMMRAWTIQLLVESTEGDLPNDMLKQFEDMARTDASPVVRLYLCSAAQRMSIQDRWTLVENLSMHPEDATDHNLPLMVWFAAEPFAKADPQRALAFAMSAGSSLPRVRDFMVRTIGSHDPAATLSLLIDGLSQADDDATRLTFLRGIQESITGRRDLKPSESWTRIENRLRLSDNLEVVVLAEFVSASFGDHDAKKTLVEIASQAENPLGIRRRSIGLLADLRDANVSDVAIDWMKIPEIRGAVLSDVTTLAGDNTPDAVISVYDELSLAERKQALSALSSYPAFAVRLLDAIENQRIPKADLTADLVRQLKNLDDESINERIALTWGVVRETNASVAEQITQIKGLIGKTDSAHVDVEMGRAIFAKTCQQCHQLFGTGGKVGPDLTGSNRKDLDYLLTNMLDPSSVMAKEYQTTVVATIDGRVITGIARPAPGGRLDIINETQTVRLTEDDIDEVQTLPKSMMPEDLLSPLNDREVLSLIAYLRGNGQTPMLARTENVRGFFNGVDLTGWIGDESLWRVENGEIVGISKGLDHNEFLVNELSFGDFRFSVEVKLVDNEGNSGIQFRSRPMSDGEVNGYQADIGVGWWGKLYEELGRGLLEEAGAAEHVIVGGWNRYEIMAVGSRVQMWLNGHLCVNRDDPLGAQRGVFALQLHSGGPMEIRFRDLQIELIESPDQQSEYRSSLPLTGEQKIGFEKRQLDTKFRSEGVAVGDFNNDGKLDIAAGSVWYEAPEWKMHSILEKPNEFKPKGYSNTFCNFAEDINGDGRVDLVVVDFPGAQTWWYENPGDVESAWKQHELTPVTNNESPVLVDVTGDGRREMLFGGEEGYMTFATPQSHPDAVWKLNAISLAGAPGTQRFAHGLGVGDVNRDGKRDVMVPQGWWEGPSEDSDEPWVFHPAPWGEPCAHMFAYDFDNDGDQDVVSSSAHNYGIWWHEKTDSGWQTHEIDKSFSQTHSLCLADMNGDGKPDLVTGKRFWAHNGNDPGGNEPAVLFWFELQQRGGKAEWIAHQIDHDSGVGTQFEVTDVDRDGMLDIVISNKKGVFYFRQTREE